VLLLLDGIAFDSTEDGPLSGRQLEPTSSSGSRRQRPAAG
jgi:hypothetical protein